MNKEFKKEDLKTGMLVELRDSNSYLIVPYGNNNELILIGNDLYGELKNYNSDLTHSTYKCLDIIKVYSQNMNQWKYTLLDTNGRQLLWERKEDDNKRKENIKKKNEMLEQREKLIKEIEDKKKQLFVLDKSYNQFMEENFKEDKEYYIPKDNPHCIEIDGKSLMDIIINKLLK